MADQTDVDDLEKEIKNLEQHGQSMGQVNEETKKAIDSLTTGVLSAFLPEMENVKERINELTQNQGILIETIQQENTKFLESQEAKAILEVVSQVQKYQSKLNKIHQDMELINERIGRLKRRANKLKQQKEKDEQTKWEAKQRELEIEQELIAKPAAEPKS